MADERRRAFLADLAALNEHHLVGVPDASEVWLIRHADAYSGLESLEDGVLDPVLTLQGHAQAKRLAGRLAGLPVDRVWSSTLRRARQTADSVAAVHGLDVLSDPRLREVRTHWDEGTPASQLVRGSYPFPEPEEEVFARMREAIGDVVAGLGPPIERRRRAVVVSHSAAILLYIAHTLGLTWNGLRIFPQFTSISVVVVRGDRTVVQSVADVSHLANLDGQD